MGLTTPGEMKGWASELLCFDTINYDSTYFTGEFDAMEKAAQVRSAGGVAFLLVDAALVDEKEPVVATPNHWVSFLGDLDITGDDERHIRFKCYSWGGDRVPLTRMKKRSKTTCGGWLAADREPGAATERS